ncbi:hypothetical protein HNQ85_003324 [Anoxybacillus calidus]|jgi:hypothetical protein|uniref:Uncharacterized protein n=1 Tax=[Anoxybacillus] calidus TaxID=575178 RepID=A0A7W0BYD8_9BACL|nr:hypothetical protein [Anoxybacillus calidus]MBA2873009.1 hypothetical protein [Anoxybacillus calidus]
MKSEDERMVPVIKIAKHDKESTTWMIRVKDANEESELIFRWGIN